MDGFENIRAVEIKAFPNPVIEHFTLDIYTLLAEKGTFQLTDLNGKVVLQEEIVLNAGNNHIKIELGESYTSGVYIINLTTNDGKGSLKIIKN